MYYGGTVEGLHYLYKVILRGYIYVHVRIKFKLTINGAVNSWLRFNLFLGVPADLMAKEIIEL